MQITLIRHLPTEWNNKTWLQGRRDIEICPLSDEHRQGILENQKTLTIQSPFDIVLASSLVRTHQTAHLYGQQPETESLLDELDFGPFEGQPKKKLIDAIGTVWIEDPMSLSLGEDLVKLEDRIVQFLKKYRQYDNILVFGHGSWIRAISSYWKYGHINNMNKLTVANNECITLEFMTVS
ncbi:histidine phosphatase family protein [Mesobacillus maritimus]|uniref:Phosphoglycerate mutase family protein n=1 Tax=Mesobacillus maritimus TaxID=1643336 RepID=A0ABS7K0E9_9BACI|nr:phosphoglycerate mutase family protein [Mesobacillus maritimus]MBY0095626.1 phosphoglycerate mutase family protein [Mesobacillus maritimus]